MEKNSRRTFKSLLQGLPHYIVLLMKQVAFFKNLKISTELVSTLLVFTYGIVFMTIPNITTVYPIGHDTSAYLWNLKLMYEINFKSDYIYAYPLLPLARALGQRSFEAKREIHVERKRIKACTGLHGST